MDGITKSFALAVTTLSAAVILVVAFAWFGPGASGVTPAAKAALFDENLVQSIYEKASPAVVDINVDRKIEDAFGHKSLASGRGCRDIGRFGRDMHGKWLQMLLVSRCVRISHL